MTEDWFFSQRDLAPPAARLTLPEPQLLLDRLLPFALLIISPHITSHLPIFPCLLLLSQFNTPLFQLWIPGCSNSLWEKELRGDKCLCQPGQGGKVLDEPLQRLHLQHFDLPSQDLADCSRWCKCCIFVERSLQLL